MDQKHYLALENLMAKLFEKRPTTSVDEIEAEWKLISDAGAEKINIKQVRAVPKASFAKFKNGIKYKVYTGHEVHMVGGWPHNARDMVHRVEKLVVHLAPFTNDEFKAGKLKLTRAEAQIQGQTYQFKIKNLGFKANELYSDDNKFEFENSKLGTYYFTVSTSKEYSSSVQDITGISFSLALRTADGQQTYLQPSYVPKGTPPVTYKDVIQEANPKTFTYDQKACPVKVNGTMKSRWLEGDNEFRSFDRVVVSGLISKKDIVVTAGYPYANYYYQQHETYEDIWIDLFADTTLTQKERTDLAKSYGRFIEIVDREGSFKFWDESGKKSKSIKGCSSAVPNESDSDSKNDSDSGSSGAQG